MSAPSVGPRLLHDYAEAAYLLSASERTVQRLVASGELDSVLLGRRRLIPHTALEAYVARLERESA